MNQPIIRPTKESLEQLSHSDLVALVLSLFDHIDRVSTRVEELESKLNKNSKNSNKLPSSDGLKRQPAHPRQQGQRPSGGQKGHKGHSLEIWPTIILQINVQSAEVVDLLEKLETAMCHVDQNANCSIGYHTCVGSKGIADGVDGFNG